MLPCNNRQGKSLSFSDADWRIPPQGLLTFDFVALYRPGGLVLSGKNGCLPRAFCILGDLIRGRLLPPNRSPSRHGGMCLQRCRCI